MTWAHHGIGLPGRFLQAATIVTLVGCTVEIEMASHKPAHPVGESVVLSATASGSVDRIELWVREEGIAPVGSLATPDTDTLIAICDPFLWRSTLTCTAQKPRTDDHTLVRFEARAYPATGSAVSEAYQFASGTYHYTNPLPAHMGAIPIRVKEANTDNHLDIVLIPGDDLRDPGQTGNLAGAGFRSQLAGVLELFFRYDAFREARHLYNFYYSPVVGNYIPSGSFCDWSDPDNFELLVGVADVIVYLHKGTMGDCYEADRMSSEIDNDKSLVHEAGHGLFGVRDEYTTHRYPQQDCMKNIWRTSATGGPSGLLQCEAEAPELGLSPNDCKSINDVLRVYKIDPHRPDDEIACIMGESNAQNADFSDYGPACTRRVNWVHSNCLDGVCTSDCP